MSDQPVQPIQLPLVTRCVVYGPSSDLLGGGSEPTIQIQLNTLGGRYLPYAAERTCRPRLTERFGIVAASG